MKDQTKFVANKQLISISVAEKEFVDLTSGTVIKSDLEVLEEDLSSSYEPTQEEIEEYALYLGMNITEDKNLFYIAKEGLKAPMAANWKPVKTEDGQIYYFNFESHSLQRAHPCDEYYKQQYQREVQAIYRKKAETDLKVN